jgi:hypothetical protein
MIVGLPVMSLFDYLRTMPDDGDDTLFERQARACREVDQFDGPLPNEPEIDDATPFTPPQTTPDPPASPAA